MTEKLISQGKCIYCNQLISKTKIGKHLANHFEEMEKTGVGKNAKTYCHIEVEAHKMFLQLLVKGGAKLEKIDEFLREIWLECCGHLSEFEFNRETISMNKKVWTVFEPQIKIQYEYDFGTTTKLLLKGLEHYKLDLEEDIILLSRNEPFPYMCTECKTEPAICMCTTCCYEDYSFFCKKCAKKHSKTCGDFDDYSSMPVVNSPRMGECGYTGGRIDLERDGIYKKV